MLGANLSDVVAALNCQFSRHCSQSEPILSQLADDFIARYSPKHQPHPDFFKEDAALAHNQLTLYADQCIQVMRNFDFLKTPADIISNLTTANLRINDFLAKQLFHYMKQIRPQVSSHSLDTLCSGCGRLRENEKLRSLKEELIMRRVDWHNPKIIHEAFTRTGQKYDVEWLIQQELESLDQLNESQVRKRLSILEIDHDKRNQEILVCLQQLKRANDRVTGYGKNIQKKGKDAEGQFNVKDYVFQISRHFYHNIAGLDNKIKLLKQTLSPIDQAQTQTEQNFILLSEHQELVNQLTTDLKQTKQGLIQHQTLLTIEQRKCREYTEMNIFLQQKLKEVQIKRQEEKISQTITKIQLNGSLTQTQNKVQSLENLVIKLKSFTKTQYSSFEEEMAGNSKKKQHIGIQCDQCETSTDRSNEIRGQEKEKVYLKALISNKTQWRQSLLLNPQSIIGINSFQSITNQLSEQVKTISPALKAIITSVCDSNRAKLSISATINETIFAVQRTQKENSFQKKKEAKSIIENISKERNEEEEYDQVNRMSQRSNVPYEQKKTKKLRVNKRPSPPVEYSNIMTKTKSRRSVLEPQTFKQLPLRKQQQEQAQIRSTQFEKKEFKLKQKKTLYEVRKFINEPQEDKTKQQGGIFNKTVQPHQVSFKKRKKKRNFSQQHNFQEYPQGNVRISMEKQSKQNRFFGDLSQLLVINSNGQKSPKKQSIYKRAQYSKYPLSLQQINYSTYFYSLIAKMHLKNPNAYLHLKKHMSILSGQSDEESNVKSSLKILLITHRRCTGNGSICIHLQSLIQKVKSM